MEENNLFIPLHVLASRQDENFLTEIFIFLLRYFVEHEQISAISLLNNISGGLLKLSHNELGSVNISTRSKTAKGIPDIEIRTREFLLFIEVKVDSDFRCKQLERYKSVLKASGLESALITLTRYHYKLHKADLNPDYSFRWHNLADWLKGLNLVKPISNFITKQFLILLKNRGIIMETINWQLMDGVRSLKNLVDMIEEALSALKIPINQRTGAWGWIGYYIEDKKYFVGIYFDKPHLVILNTEVALIDNLPDEPDIGKFVGRWQNELDLSSESVFFFARTKASQLACLEEFIKESVDYGKTLIKTIKNTDCVAKLG